MAKIVLVIDDNSNGRPARTMDQVLREVAREFWISRFRIRARTRSQTVCVARDELCRRLHADGYSYRDIGEFLHGRDHSTIIYAVQRARARLPSS